jgi:hypothetical protein
VVKHTGFPYPDPPDVWVGAGHARDLSATGL